ncbi:helix-turn-helix domain-containing protein [[Clostridium] fimetarium]|uniref:DNA binding domain-containing protein, excisionase family n=1 Tax=[Clostridium] fimetarium TaxID=99656 RepID=A0A1I0QVE1_9FIRM|nr:helix-turn-helix domain-containing protein [[Clostridium] fimetarium]SEW31622.1 DNA binding domain-containing protein, excisionase family [[Clostridium] fimetarium]
MNKDKKLLNTKDLCEYLGVGTSTAIKLIKNPSATYVIRIGSRYFVNKTLLDTFLDQHTGLGKGAF